MFFKKEDKDINYKNLNDVISLSKRLLKVLNILIILLGLYAIIKLLQELNIMPFVTTILKISAPLFIGIMIAWLFDPVVKWLNRKGIKRVLGSIITYLFLIGAIVLLISAIIPLLSNEINDFAKMLPSIFDTIKDWINGVLNKLSGIEGIDVEGIKLEVFSKIEETGFNLTESLPETFVIIVKSIFSGLGTLIIGLIIGFYLLVSFDSISSLMSFVPKKIQQDTKDLVDDMNLTLRSFVKGALLTSTLVFIVSTIGLAIIGVKAPILFGLFCGFTNVIPYVGPYIGGIPAVIVAFSQNPVTGILTLIFLVIVQFIEGNFFQPIIMSKTTKLHTVTIILGLLIFGHFFGIFGMFISTPVIAVFKAAFRFFDEKFDLLNFNK